MSTVQPVYALPESRVAGHAPRWPVSLPLLWSLAGGAASVGLLSANPLLTAAAVLVVPMFVGLLWRAGEPPALLFVVLFQWLQVSARVFHADVLGVDVNEMGLTTGAPVGEAVGLGLAALVVLALGQRLAMGRLPKADLRQLAQEATLLAPGRVFGLYAVLLVLGQTLLTYTWVFLSLGQAFAAVSQLRWVPLFVLGYLVFSRRGGRGWLMTAVGIEVVLGFGGYFSSFKTVFFVLILAALSAQIRLNMRQWIGALMLAALVFGLTLVWTGIKGDYRGYLSQGEQAQVVRVSWAERLTELGRLVGALDASDLGPALEQGVLRLAYVDFFAEALDYVPASLPHADGTLWSGALRHVLAPRLLFPDKPILPSDSELTKRYTGRDMASGEQGTSISLGYVGESYVDFGYLGMWTPIFLMGLLQGIIYAFFVRRTRLRLMGYGFAIATLLSGMLFETTAVKYLGGTLYLLIAFALVARFALPRVLPWLTGCSVGRHGGRSLAPMVRRGEA